MGVGVLRSVIEEERPDLSNLKCENFVQLSIRFWHEDEFSEWVWVRVDLIEEDAMLGTISEELFVVNMPGGAEFTYGNQIIFESHNIFFVLEEMV